MMTRLANLHNFIALCAPDMWNLIFSTFYSTSLVKVFCFTMSLDTD